MTLHGDPREGRISPVSLSIAVLLLLAGAGCLTASTHGLEASSGMAGKGGGQPSAGTSGSQMGQGSTTGTGSSNEPSGAVLTPTPSTVNFGFVPIGTTAIACTMLSNASGATIQVTGLSSFNSEDGSFALSQIDDSLPPNPAPVPVSLSGGASVEICFSFTPPIARQYNGDATLSTDAPGVVAPIVELTGWAGGPQISCAPTSIVCGQTLDHSVTTIPILCTNTGTAIPGNNVPIEIQIVGPGASAWTATIDGSNSDAGLNGLASGQTVQIDLSYTGSDGGLGDATLIIEFVGIDQAWRIPLSPCQGLDVPPCQFVISPTSLDFANAQVGDSSAPLSLEVQNVGTDVCEVQGLAIDDDSTGSFHILSTSIAPDPGTGRIAIPAPGENVTSNLTITLDFVPTLQGRSFTAEAAFSISDPSAPNQNVSLSGTSESTCLVVAPSTLDFGDAGIDDAGLFVATPPQSFSVSNLCQNTAELEAITLQTGLGDVVAQYSATIGPTLPALIGPGASLTYALSCAPTTSGPHPAQLIISDGIVETLLSLVCGAP